ncbi:MAG: putative zinc-binding metallopeptidase [Hyphomonadaceae bacterium]
MRRFHCDACRTQVFFENDLCGACGAMLGFAPRDLSMKIVQPTRAQERRRCANHESGGCNWLLEPDEHGDFCRACRHNRTIPDLSVAGNHDLWRAFEAAKRRLFYALIALDLPLRTRAEDPEHGLAFDCVDDMPGAGGDDKRAMTGHDNGIITIALAEADPVRREHARLNLGESYRTLLGHLRHEIGHYYWDILVRSRPHFLQQFRKLFGDEQQDYANALKIHYEQGPQANWAQAYVSAYASAHPWEDFAETWQHYMHLIDTLETAQAFHVAVDSEFSREGRATAPLDPYHSTDAERLAAAWTPLTVAINCLNRSMGQPDLYPFVLPGPAIQKLEFVRDLVARSREPAQAPIAGPHAA